MKKGIKVTVLHFNDGEKEVTLDSDLSLDAALSLAGHSEIPTNWYVMVNTMEREEFESSQGILENGDVISIVGNVAGGR